MKSNNISLPYPVLGINDDVFPLLDENCIHMADPIKSSSEYIFKIELCQRNKDIESLISTGKAEYACEVTCKDTFLRRCYHSSDAQLEIRVSRKEVKGRINFNCFVAAKEPIYGYINKDFNDDYRGYSFDLEIGDFLVIFPSAFYNTNIKYDKLYAAGSFMQIVKAAEGTERTWFNLAGDRILIEMPGDLFERYQTIGNTFPEVIHSSLVHNALVYALCNLDEYKNSGKLWSDSLVTRLQMPEFENISVDDLSQDMTLVYKVADILLQDPYKRLLESLEKVNNNIKEEEE